MLLPKICIIFITTILISQETLCICEDSYIVICNDFNDIQLNDTTAWRHVQIGSTQSKSESAIQTLTFNKISKLHRVTSLTIINKIKFLVTFRSVFAEKFEYLNFYQNDIKEIGDFAFKNLPFLKEVYLKNNNIQHLGRAIFSNDSLEIADLSRNNIESITTAFYESKIKRVILNYNKISFIERNAFSKVSVEVLELNHNSIQHLEKEMFKNLRNLKELDMEYNQLTSLPDMSALTSITYLHFGNNYIKEVHYRFDKLLPTLEYLDLGSNLIFNVTIEAFSSSGTPPLVVLAFNRLTNIEFKQPQRITDLVLYGNPWNCDCWFQIEKILKMHRHKNSCEFKFFDKGDIPFCIDVKKCDERFITETELEDFVTMVRVCEEEIKKKCDFRL